MAGADVKQVLFDGRRMILARYPNHDPQNPYAGGFLYVAAQPDAGSKTSFEAPTADVERVGRACSFAARQDGSTWTGEWRIPFAEAGIDLKSVKALRFNIGVRKTAGPAPWICWVGTGGPNFEVDSAGEVLLNP